MQRFDLEKPGMADLEPGDRAILDEEDFDEDKYYYDEEDEEEEGEAEEWEDRQLRGAQEASASASRNLKFTICPKCKRSRNWKRVSYCICDSSSSRNTHFSAEFLTLHSSLYISLQCIKNRCKTSKRRAIKRKKTGGNSRRRQRRRKLKRHDQPTVWTPEFKGLFGGWKNWDKKDEAESEMKKESMEKEAANLRGSARQVHGLALEYQHTDSEYASLLQDKANLMLASAELNAQMADLLEMNIVTSKQNAFLVKHSDKLHKLEMEWAKAMEMTGVKADEEVKSVGKLEHDLNKVVGWFSKVRKAQSFNEIHEALLLFPCTYTIVPHLLSLYLFYTVLRLSIGCCG